MNYEWNSREETAAVGFWALAVGEYREHPLLAEQPGIKDYLRLSINFSGLRMPSGS